MSDPSIIPDGATLATPAPEPTYPELDVQAANRAQEIIDLEKAVIGAAMNSRPRAEYLLSKLTPVHFTDQRNQEMWAAVTDLVGRGEPVDVNTLRREINQRRGHTDPQGDLYVVEVDSSAATAGSDGYYVDLLRSDYQRRRADAIRTRAATLTHPAKDWHAEGEAGNDPLSQIIADYQRLQLETDEDEMTVAGDEAAIEDIIAGWGMKPACSFDLGLSNVDAELNVEPGSLVVFGAYTGVGKSTLASQAARRSMDRGLPTVQFSAEMSTNQLRQRDLCAMAGVHLSTAAGNRELTTADQHLLVEHGKRYAELSRDVGYYIEHVPGSLSVNHIRARLSWLKRKHGDLGTVVIDYLQLMKLEPGDDQNARTAATTTALKQLAGEMQCVIVLLSQCRKPEEKGVPRPPTRWDLIGASAIANDADLVILVHDPCPKSVPPDELSPEAVARRGEVDLILAKNRSGPEKAVALADMRHMAHFAEDEDAAPTERTAMSVEDRVNGPAPSLN